MNHSAKIVEGRLQKMRDQSALMNQATLSNPDKNVSELVKETIAAVGENVKVGWAAAAAALRSPSVLVCVGLCL